MNEPLVVDRSRVPLVVELLDDRLVPGRHVRSLTMSSGGAARPYCDRFDKEAPMAKVRFGLTMSLDGFVAGPNPSVEKPLGEGGMQLHDWAFGLEAWRRPHGLEGGEVNESTAVIEASIANAGAYLMGRNMFGGGPGDWGDGSWRGWWGDDPPFHVPVFVLTHHAREPLVMDGGTTFVFSRTGSRRRSPGAGGRGGKGRRDRRGRERRPAVPRRRARRRAHRFCRAGPARFGHAAPGWRRGRSSSSRSTRSRRPASRICATGSYAEAGYTVVLRASADVAELVDAHGSGPCGRKPVEVQVLSSA